jgi:uncharacterized protein YegP (UPF0339 family)
MKSPKVEIYRERCGACDGSGELESEDSTDDHIYKCSSCDGEGKKDWGWRLKAGNGEIVASGEGHTRPADAERAFRTVVATVIEVLEVFFKDPGGWTDIVVVRVDD